MNNIAIIINSPYLGGAERSIVTQMKQMQIVSNSQLTFIIPYLIDKNESDKIEEFILRSHPNAKVIKFKYNQAIYELSRSGLKYLPFKIVAFLLLMISIHNIGLEKYDTIWINGNKVGFPLLLFLNYMGYEKNLIYHLRDYPFNSGVYKIIWKLLNISNKMKRIVISNSYDVKLSFDKLITDKSIISLMCYNPIEIDINIENRFNNNIEIAIASMFAPWKGIHSILIFESIYREQLKELGVSKIRIYGDDIYRTKGEHVGYKKQLLSLCGEDSLVHFEGLSTPEDIFKTADILIHPSLREEPFGRIIIEAFRSEVAVISTCLGGSGELIDDGLNGFQFIPYDYAGLFSCLKKLSNSEKRRAICQKAKEKDEKIIDQQKAFWQEISKFL